MEIIQNEEERYYQAKKRVEAIKGFYGNLTSYIVLNIFFFILNMVTSPEHLWFYWPLLGWGVSHRVGTLKPGEVSVVVAVSSPHRQQAFEACQFIIDTLKEKAPIFKKEIFEDGEEWVSARPTLSTYN